MIFSALCGLWFRWGSRCVTNVEHSAKFKLEVDKSLVMGEKSFGFVNFWQS
ncbi:hypothetical protein SHAQ108633_15805 [Shewanella aquimarina]